MFERKRQLDMKNTGWGGGQYIFHFEDADTESVVDFPYRVHALRFTDCLIETRILYTKHVRLLLTHKSDATRIGAEGHCQHIGGHNTVPRPSLARLAKRCKDYRQADTGGSEGASGCARATVWNMSVRIGLGAGLA